MNARDALARIASNLSNRATRDRGRAAQAASKAFNVWLSRGAGSVVSLKVAAVAAVVIVAFFVLTVVLLVILGARADALEQGATATMSCDPSHEAPAQLADFMSIYEAAASKFELGERGVWMLGSVHMQETRLHPGGPDAPRSYADAVGPMQFLPSTWARGHSNSERRVVVKPTTRDSDGYATDGDNDGLADTHDLDDAVFSAARMLHANGAPGNWLTALWAYNPVMSYGAEVVTRANAWQGTCQVTSGAGSVIEGSGKFILGPGANRAGVELQPELTGFVRRMAEFLPRPPVITTGTNHSKYTTTGNESDHWTGFGADFAWQSNGFPATGGGYGDTIAEAALLAAGEPAASARAKALAGGVFNIVRDGLRIQIIWKSYTGGNHYNHIHVGVRRVR